MWSCRGEDWGVGRVGGWGILGGEGLGGWEMRVGGWGVLEVKVGERGVLEVRLGSKLAGLGL